MQKNLVFFFIANSILFYEQTKFRAQLSEHEKNLSHGVASGSEITPCNKI